MNNDLISTSGNQKKSVRILFFIIIIAIIGLAVWLFGNFLNNNTKAVPDGYYVYDKYIIEQKDPASAAYPLIYEGLDTTSLVLDEKSLAKVCDQSACYKYPKVVDEIKKLLTGRPSREYIRPSL